MHQETASVEQMTAHGDVQFSWPRAQAATNHTQSLLIPIVCMVVAHVVKALYTGLTRQQQR